MPHQCSSISVNNKYGTDISCIWYQHFCQKSNWLSKTVPRYLYSATLSTVTSSMISSGTGGGGGGGGWAGGGGGGVPKVNYHFLCFNYVQVKIVFFAPCRELMNFAEVN